MSRKGDAAAAKTIMDRVKRITNAARIDLQGK
jgi:hypothetical protein